MKNNKKYVIGAMAALAAVIVAVIISSITFALFTSKKEESARINIGNLDVILIEDWPEEIPEIGLEQNTKTVHGESVREKKAYVRMRFIPVIEYKYEAEENGEQISEWRTAPVPQKDIKLTITDNNNKWIKQGEYYYYSEILNSRESTTDLNVEWEIIELPSTLKNYQIRTDVRVLLEYSQISNEIWKEIFQIENLPAGVER